MGFIGLAIALPPPSVHEVSQSPLLIQIQIQIHIYLFDRCPNQVKFSCQKDCQQDDCQKSRCGWRPTCLSPDFPSTSKLPTVNPSKYIFSPLWTLVNISVKPRKHPPPWWWIIVIATILRVCDLLDYTADDLTGKSMYSLVHAADVHKIKQTHVDCKWCRWLK